MSSCVRCFAPLAPTTVSCPGCGKDQPAALGARLRDEAIACVADAADPAWMSAAVVLGERLARAQPTLTTDDLWRALDGKVTTREPRAMGAVMRVLSNRGVVRNAGRQVPSDRPECHRRPLTVWESCVYGR